MSFLKKNYLIILSFLFILMIISLNIDFIAFIFDTLYPTTTVISQDNINLISQDNINMDIVSENNNTNNTNNNKVVTKKPSVVVTPKEELLVACGVAAVLTLLILIKTFSS